MITADNLSSWITTSSPLHASYPYLSAVHRSDYLRAYFMHHYGGGYSDIKQVNDSWLPAFDRLMTSDALGIGYKEVSRKGVAHIHRQNLNGRFFYADRPVSRWTNLARYYFLKAQWRALVGNCAYIFKPNTGLTKAWVRHIEARLDFALPFLKVNPAQHPRAKRDDADILSHAYPLPWSFICADVFHPLVFKNRKRILQGLPAPSFKTYL